MTDKFHLLGTEWFVVLSIVTKENTEVIGKPSILTKVILLMIFSLLYIAIPIGIYIIYTNNTNEEFNLLLCIIIYIIVVVVSAPTLSRSMLLKLHIAINSDNNTVRIKESMPIFTKLKTATFNLEAVEFRINHSSKILMKVKETDNEFSLPIVSTNSFEKMDLIIRKLLANGIECDFKSNEKR